MNKTQTVVSTIHGSRLFGCATPSSDYDYKEIVAASFSDLVLRKDEIEHSKVEVDGIKHETERFTPHSFTHLLKKGQVIAIEMLFTPDDKLLFSSHHWERLRMNSDKVVSKHIMPFIHYARNQAERYGVKGKKLQTLIDACNILTGMVSAKAVVTRDSFMNMYNCLHGREGVSLVTKTEAGDNKLLYMGICGKWFSETTDFELWLEPLIALRNEFGNRSKEALAAGGSDLKAQYHCVRLCHEAMELWTTGKLTFPRPEAELLKDIRGGKYNKESLEILISKVFTDLELIMKSPTVIPPHPDEVFLDNWAVRTQRHYVLPDLTVCHY